MKKQQTSPSKVLVVITLVVAAIIVALVVIGNKEEKETMEKTPKNLPPVTNQPTLGETNAPIVITEFGDYKCPACKAWGEQIFPQLQKDYIDSGKVKFSYVN